MVREPTTEEWRHILNGEIRGLRSFQRLWKKIPSEPRCKLCYAPFGKPGNFLIRVFGGKPSPLNRRLCTWCIKSAHKHPGGAEVEISALGGVAPDSPLGSALMGAAVGDVVDVEAPRGSWRARVLAIRRS